MDATTTRFRSWIEFTGLSQDHLADRLGCSQSLISAVSRGLRRPGVDLIHSIERMTAEPREDGTRWHEGPIRTEEWLPDAESHRDPAFRSEAELSAAHPTKPDAGGGIETVVKNARATTPQTAEGSR